MKSVYLMVTHKDEIQYRELIAMYYLKTIDAKRFADLGLADRLDLQDVNNSLGVEVTSGIYQDVQRDVAIYRR